MNRLELKLEESLKKTGLTGHEVDVYTVNLGKVFATLKSPTFDGMEESERQGIVWKQLLTDLDEEELLQVEFVYTRDSNDK